MEPKEISLLEQKETIDTALLSQIANALKLPVEAFKNFDEKQVINIISNNTFDNCAQPIAGTVNYHECTFNPIDKLTQLHDEKIALYERMLKEKDEMMARLEKLLERT